MPSPEHDIDPAVADLKVCGASSIGWDANTPPNETSDAQGNPAPLKRGFAVADHTAPAERRYDNPEVQALRTYLQANNGLKGMDVASPDEPARAARLLWRDGFVVVRDLLSPDQLEQMREGSARALRDILSVPGPDGRKYTTETGRLPHRYSYGTCSASRHLLHDSAWADMIDLPTTTPILKALFGGPDYHVIGAGGDLCLPGAIEYQHLHRDVFDAGKVGAGRLAHARALGIDIREDDDGHIDNGTLRLIIERTAPCITINFFMSDLTWENGPIRQIPGTHANQQNPPKQEDEPAWMRLSTLVGGKAGWGVFRDTRAWHGATPNLSREIRAMPNIEYAPPWSDDIMQTMPHEVWAGLSPHAQHVSRLAKAPAGVWPKGAGILHPLAHERDKAAGGDLKRPGRGY
ncbi:MAG: phytanoyl-CoA dioxygenase family protein [Pseudomonadota bacterium]